MLRLLLHLSSLVLRDIQFGATVWHASCLDRFAAMIRSSSCWTTRPLASWSKFFGKTPDFPTTPKEQNLGNFNAVYSLISPAPTFLSTCSADHGPIHSEKSSNQFEVRIVHGYGNRAAPEALIKIIHIEELDEFATKMGYSISNCLPN